MGIEIKIITMKKNNNTEFPVLRQKAEEQLKIRKESAGTDIAPDECTAAETLKLIHEFEVHQIELEMQNQELILAKEQAIIASEKYIELYDFAPTGYFTLSRDGEIIQLNITGAKMLGKARSQLKNRLFHLFVSDTSKPFFLHFLEKVFDRHEKEICELTIPTNDDIPIYIYITGIVSGNGSNCLITAIDITERKLLESSIVEKMILLYETERAGKIGGWSFNVKTLTQNFTQETFNILEIDSANGEPKVPEGIEFIDDSSRRTAQLAIKRAIEFGEPFVQEWNVITGKGNKRWINVVGKANWVKGKIISITGSFQDITERKQAEEDLRVSNEFNKILLQTIPMEMDIVDENGNILFMSEGLKQHFGNRTLDKKCWELYRDDKKQCKECPLRTDIKTGETRVNEAHGVFGGKIFEVSHTGMIYNGKKALLEIFSDITEQKRTEVSLLVSEIKYHAIFENVQDVFYQTDLAGIILEVSPSIENILGFSRDQIIGKPIAKLSFDFKSRDMFFYKLKKNGELRDYELRLKTKTGEFKYTSINARLIFDADGKPNHIDGAIRDITHRKLAEIELRASKDYLNNIINAVASPMFVKDDNHKYVLANNALCSLINIPKEKIIGSNDSEYFSEEQLKVFIEKDNEVFNTGKENINEEYLTDGTGNVRTIVTRKTLYTDTAGNKFLVGVINDITERKLAEKQIERLNRVYTVLSNINKTIIRVRDKQFLFEEACRIAVENGGFIMAWMGMVNSETNKIDVVATSGITGEFINYINIDLNNEALNSGPAGMTIKTGKSNFSNNIQTDDRKFYWRKTALEYGYRSIIALPVIVRGKTIGAYMIYSGEIDFFNGDEIKLLEEMASDISFAIEFIESRMERTMAEKALRKSEAIQRKIVSNIGDVIVIIDQNGINRYKSPNIETLFGWKPEEMVGKSMWDVVHPDDLDSSKKIVAEIALIPNASATSEIRYRRKDGIYVWIEVIIVNLLSDPEIQGFLGNYHDITDRRLAQVKIREKDLEFKKLSSNLPDLIFQFTRRSDGTYCVPIASEGIKNIFGCSPEDVIDDFTPIARVIYPEDVDRVIADIEYSAKHLTHFACEFRVQLPGKPIQWIYSKSTPEKLPDGSVTWYGFNADISERKRIEDSLVKLKTAIDKSEISVVITDRNGNIEYANPFFTKLTGYSPDEYIGKTPRILKSEYHTKEFYEEMWNTINSGKTWEGEFYNCNKNGEMYWENAIISPVTNSNNEITHFVAIKTDITHAKNINSELIIAKEHAEESDRLKSAFLANMSHEIRTPMNGILGFTELLKEPDLSDDQQKYFISIIEKSGARLLNIINDIIDISKIESGLMKVKNSEINVNEYLDQILTFFKPEAEAKNIKLICKSGLPKEEVFLETDSEKFYAILINLVNNALKYTETGFVEFGYNRVKTLHKTSHPNHSYLQFYVKDTGIGIPKDRQEAIFERFVQADIVNKMARQGAGLGLSISKAYVEMLRGKIWLESEEENLSAGKSGGSTFYFTLPFYTLESENVKRIDILNPEKEVQNNNLKILIAEDEESSSKLISIYVHKFGNEIINVQSGTEAVEACRNNPDIDLILMDIQMPELNGYDATRQIRQFNKKVIIIALTAFALAGDREKAIEAGCNDYISKPVKMAALVGMIQKYFKV